MYSSEYGEGAHFRISCHLDGEWMEMNIKLYIKLGQVVQDGGIHNSTSPLKHEYVLHWRFIRIEVIKGLLRTQWFNLVQTLGYINWSFLSLKELN